MSSKLKVPPLCVIIGTVPLLPVAAVPSLAVAEVHGNKIIQLVYSLSSFLYNGLILHFL